jgi:hypothetical protein
MRIALALAIAVLAMWLSAGCGATDSLPTSSLTIRDTLTDYLLSTPDVTGTMQLTVGETKQVKILRTFKGSNNQTETDDVTQFANLKWESGSTVAGFDQLGNISGLSVGTAMIEAKFRANAFDPWDHCKLQVVVTAAP